MSAIITVPTRLDLIKLLPMGAIMAEIGVHKGWFSIEILNHAPNIAKLYAVDAWVSQPLYNDPLSNTDHEANLAETKHHLRGHLPSKRVEIIRGDSLKVASEWISPKLDAVFIDAAHDFGSVVLDLYCWSKALAHNGVILGHDYTRNDTAKKYGWGVIEAVEFFCKRFGWKLTHLTNEDFASYRLEKV